jgi:hypothetical protein
MRGRDGSSTVLALPLAACILAIGAPQLAFAHCDTMGGPVVTSARDALQEADVTPALKWVKPQHELEVREAFARTLEVRKASGTARDLADRYFFETLVRVHREGEGEPYTGLKPSGPEPEGGIAAADRALEKSSVDDLVRSMTAQVTTGIRDRYSRTIERRQHAEESVQAGRAYVEAYVEFIHYVERLQEDVTGSAGHGEASSGKDPATHH